jgi:ABC-type nitrate/sulfonate/bicarbonate transport system permease component
MNAPNFHPAMHSPSNWAIAGRLVERVLNRVLWLSLLTTFPAGACLIAYIIGGYIAVSTGAITPGYRFLAVNTDPVFNGLVALVTCVSVSARVRSFSWPFFHVSIRPTIGSQCY